MKQYKNINKIKSLIVKFTTPLAFEVVLFFLGLSGWVGYLYMIVDDSPKIQGNIVSIMIATSSERGNFTLYTLYPYIVNNSKYDIELIEFNLEVDYGDGKGYVAMMKNLIQKDLNHFSIKDENNKDIKIENWSKQQIYNKSLVAKFGIPLHGFVTFKGPINKFEIDPKSFKLICTDINNNKYTLYSDKNKMKHFLWKELAGVKEYNDYTIIQ